MHAKFENLALEARRGCTLWQLGWILVISVGLAAGCETSPSAAHVSASAIQGAQRHGDPRDAGEPMSDSGDAASFSDAAGPVAPKFSDIYGIIQSSCGGGSSGCHVGGAPAMLAMPDADTAYSNLVDIASSKCAGAVRVVPGNADESVLVGTLEGTLDCVQRMPRGRDPLSDDEVAMIRAWIAAGAIRD